MSKLKRMLPLLMMSMMAGSDSPFNRGREHKETKLDKILNNRELLIKEGELIKQKKSNFTANDRRVIQFRYERLMKKASENK